MTYIYQDHPMTLKQLSEIAGVKEVTIWARVRAGWTVEKAATTPALIKHTRSRPRMRHGLSKAFPIEFKLWIDMRNRCENPNNKRFFKYGERGIKVCERWANFANFIADMGQRPSESLSIERKDNEGDYAPGNCIWATATAQARNRRSSRLLTHDGETITAAEWAERIGISASTILARIDRHEWSVSDALTTPIVAYRRGGNPN